MLNGNTVKHATKKLSMLRMCASLASGALFCLLHNTYRRRWPLKSVLDHKDRQPRHFFRLEQDSCASANKS